MKILSVVPSYTPAFQYGGPIYSVHGLNKVLVKKGVDITVYTTNVGLNGKVPVNHEIKVDDVKVTYFEFINLFELLGDTGWQFSWRMTNHIKKSLKAFDLIHINAVWNYPVTAAAYYCRKYKKPHIITPRGVLYPYTTAKKAWKKTPYYRLIAKRDIMRASAIHYTTEDEFGQCHSSLGLKNKALIIPNGIDRSEFDDLPHKDKLRDRYPIMKDKKAILFLGRINWIKGLDILVTAFARLVRKKYDIHLLIAGPDEKGYKNKVTEWIYDEGLRDKVTFSGMLNGKEKLEALSGSELCVLPSYSENFGMAAVEAMACGVPVVISDKVGIYREIEQNKAGIVVKTNPESLYEGIKQILDNDEVRKEIALNGRRLVEDYYDIDNVADKVIEAYKNMIKGENCG